VPKALNKKYICAEMENQFLFCATLSSAISDSHHVKNIIYKREMKTEYALQARESFLQAWNEIICNLCAVRKKRLYEPAMPFKSDCIIKNILKQKYCLISCQK